MLFADHALAVRLESADAAGSAECVRIYAQLHSDRGAAVVEVAGGYALYAGLDSPLTQAVGLGMEAPATASDIDGLEAFYQSKRAPVIVELCPLADAALLSLLSKRGYRLIEHSNVLYQPIGPGDSFAGEDADIKVEPIAPDQVRAWARVVTRGFTSEEDLPDELVDVVETTGHLASAASFLARIDGEPAGGGSVAVCNRVAAIFGQSTLPQFRGRGVQRAVLLASLEAGARAGCDVATIFTMPGTSSQRNAERQGFRVAYTRSKLLRTWD